MGQRLSFDARRSVFEKLGEGVCFAHESDGREGEQYFDFRPDGKPIAEMCGGFFLPVRDAVREMNVAEVEGIGEQEEDEVVARVRVLGEGAERAQGACGVAILEPRLQREKVRALKGRTFKAREETLVGAQLVVHVGEGLLCGRRAPTEGEGDEELQREEHSRRRPVDEGERRADDGEGEGGGQNPGDEDHAHVRLPPAFLQHGKERLRIVAVGQKRCCRREVEDEQGTCDQLLDGRLPLPGAREIGGKGGERSGQAVASCFRSRCAEVLIDGIGAEEAQVLRLRFLVLEVLRARHRKAVPRSGEAVEEGGKRGDMAFEQQPLLEEAAMAAQERAEGAGECDGDEIEPEGARVPSGGEREEAEEEGQQAQPRKHLSLPIETPLRGEIRLASCMKEVLVHKALSLSLENTAGFCIFFNRSITNMLLLYA